MSDALQSITKEYRWGLVASDEPVGIRTIRGYVTILDRRNARDAPIGYHILFFDAGGRPIQSFLADDFPLFVSAAYAAWHELGLPDIGGSPGPGERIATLIPLAGVEG